MLRRMICFIGLEQGSSPSSKRVVDAEPSSRRRTRAAVRFQPPEMFDTLHEVAVYIHRFHNLDLFQQGWYQMKISMRWEDDSYKLNGTPARVVQYEAPDVISDDILGVWRIDDADNSFSTQPFRIKYSRQDVLLSVMVSFNLPIGQYESPSMSAVVIKFDLMYAPVLDNGLEAKSCLDSVPAAIHEFRIPTKALLGLHSYCPVHFDAFHSVLVDLTIHTVYLKTGTPSSSKKVPRGSDIPDSDIKYDGSHQGIVPSSRMIELVKSLSASRETLLEELYKLSIGIGQEIEDFTEADLSLGKFEAIGSSLRPAFTAINGVSTIRHGAGQFDGRLLLEKSNGIANLGSDIPLQTLPKEDLLELFFYLGNQLSFLWNAFLKFHRANRAKLLEYLHQSWSIDRKAEWSIWMVHSKIEIPHRYLRSVADDSSQHNRLGRVAVQRKPDDPAQSAVSRAQLHRRSISQMKINNRSIQDLQIFGDPCRIPVIIVEQHSMTAPSHSSSNGSTLDSVNQNQRGENAAIGVSSKKGCRVLKVVVFVHGFQGHHLDLRLVRNQWLLLDPTAECLMSEVNEDRTSEDFREMGSRLADEVVSYIRKKIDKYSRHGGFKDIKLSFVGHSIGNIIIRSALTESAMEPFLKNLYTYMSISGPHLGYWYSSNSLFNLGLWLFKKLKGAVCIQQLTITDDPDPRNTFFYKLCKHKTLDSFRNIILLSSPQDGYVPYHSARIEPCPSSSSDGSKRANVFTEMLNNCLDQLLAPSSSQQRVFMSCDVSFDMVAQGRNLNTMIGRAAHIEFLETDVFAKFIMWSFTELFL